MYYNKTIKKHGWKRMKVIPIRSLEKWVLAHAEASHRKLYFTINGDVPLVDSSGKAVFYQIPVKGRWVCVLHPEHLTPVALLCYNEGVQMIQVLL